MDNDLKKLAMQTALKEMTKRGSFNICKIRSGLVLMSVTMSSEQEAFLEMLHCVDFGDMVPELRDGLKEELTKIFSSEIFEISLGKNWRGKQKTGTLNLGNN